MPPDASGINALNIPIKRQFVSGDEGIGSRSILAILILLPFEKALFKRRSAFNKTRRKKSLAFERLVC